MSKTHVYTLSTSTGTSRAFTAGDVYRNLTVQVDNGTTSTGIVYQIQGSVGGSNWVTMATGGSLSTGLTTINLTTTTGAYTQHRVVVSSNNSTSAAKTVKFWTAPYNP